MLLTAIYWQLKSLQYFLWFSTFTFMGKNVCQETALCFPLVDNIFTWRKFETSPSQIKLCVDKELNIRAKLPGCGSTRSDISVFMLFIWYWMPSLVPDVIGAKSKEGSEEKKKKTGEFVASAPTPAQYLSRGFSPCAWTGCFERNPPDIVKIIHAEYSPLECKIHLIV